MFKLTLRQLLVPDHLLGRCVSTFRLIAWLTIPLGASVAGAVTELWSAQIYFLVAGGVHLIVCLITLLTKLYNATVMVPVTETVPVKNFD
jgi:hypothetical protein